MTDISELSLGTTMRLDPPDLPDLLNFNLILEPDEGMYRGGVFKFSFTINQNFPHDPPKVRCKQKIYHPNIDLEGNVCLNILREDWKPVLNLNAIFVGLQVSLLFHGLGLEERHTVTNRRASTLTLASPSGPLTVLVPRAERIRPVE
jgi:Ubiquitin-conjugating enzyme